MPEEAGNRILARSLERIFGKDFWMPRRGEGPAANGRLPTGSLRGPGPKCSKGALGGPLGTLGLPGDPPGLSTGPCCIVPQHNRPLISTQPATSNITLEVTTLSLVGYKKMTT